jgi:hypothetical protein
LTRIPLRGPSNAALREALDVHIQAWRPANWEEAQDYEMEQMDTIPHIWEWEQMSELKRLHILQQLAKDPDPARRKLLLDKIDPIHFQYMLAVQDIVDDMGPRRWTFWGPEARKAWFNLGGLLKFRSWTEGFWPNRSTDERRLRIWNILRQRGLAEGNVIDPNNSYYNQIAKLLDLKSNGQILDQVKLIADNRPANIKRAEQLSAFATLDVKDAAKYGTNELLRTSALLRIIPDLNGADRDLNELLASETGNGRIVQQVKNLRDAIIEVKKIYLEIAGLGGALLTIDKLKEDVSLDKRQLEALNQLKYDVRTAFIEKAKGVRIDSPFDQFVADLGISNKYQLTESWQIDLFELATRSESRAGFDGDSVKQIWQERIATKEGFLYDFSNVSEKQVGPFTVQDNPGRTAREQGVNRPMTDPNPVFRPFDESALNFNKIVANSPQQNFYKTVIADENVWVNMNNAPAARNHFLVIPYPEKNQPQFMTQKALQVATEIVMPGIEKDALTESATKYIEMLQGQNIPHTVLMRGNSDVFVAFNSNGSWASINHLHFQGWFPPSGSTAIEKAPKQLIEILPGDVRVSRLNYPIETLAFELNGITIYVSPRSRERRGDFIGGIGALEVAGHIYTPSSQYPTITEQDIVEGLKRGSVTAEQFNQLVDQFLNSIQRPGRSEVREAPEGLGKALESVQEMKLTISLDQARREIPDFDDRLTYWAYAEQAVASINEQTKHQFAAPAQALEKATVFVNWNDIASSDRLTREQFIEDAKIKVGKDGEIILIVPTEQEGSIKAEFVSDTRIKVHSEDAYESVLQSAMNAMAIKDQDLIQVVANDNKDITAVRSAMLGAIPLSQGTIIMLGFEQRQDARIITIDQIIQATYAAAKAIAKAA